MPGFVANVCAIDFCKAFDKINHTIAIKKMINLGVDRSILPTICSFLSRRTQSVRFKGVSSESRQLSCGVPQGTKLGPITFLVMINDAAENCDYWKYVDDLSLMEVVHHSRPSEMQSNLDSLSRWCDDNDMAPKPEKCQVLQIKVLEGLVLKGCALKVVI